MAASCLGSHGCDVLDPRLNIANRPALVHTGQIRCPDVMITRPKLVLASASPRRHALLEQAGCAPDALLPTDIDETPRRGEAARMLVQRLAREKIEVALVTLASRADLTGAFTVSADTVVACTGRILPKTETVEEAEACLRLLSGRTHHVMTGIAVANAQGTIRTRLVETRVRFKHLSLDEIGAYLGSGEWRGKAGGYAIQVWPACSRCGSSVPIPMSSACRSTKPWPCWKAADFRCAAPGEKTCEQTCCHALSSSADARSAANRRSRPPSLSARSAAPISICPAG